MHGWVPAPACGSKKLSTIRHLTSNHLRLDPSSLALATYIVYSLSANGTERNLSLSEQYPPLHRLRSYGAPPNKQTQGRRGRLFCISPTNIDIPNYTYNYNKVSILFIIGLILAYGETVLYT